MITYCQALAHCRQRGVSVHALSRLLRVGHQEKVRDASKETGGSVLPGTCREAEKRVGKGLMPEACGALHCLCSVSEQCLRAGDGNTKRSTNFLIAQLLNVKDKCVGATTDPSECYAAGLGEDEKLSQKL